MVAAMHELEQKYRALVERISGYPMTEAARARILDEVEAIYRTERAVRTDRDEDRGSANIRELHGTRQVGAASRPPRCQRRRKPFR
jgi:heme oxygenase